MKKHVEESLIIRAFKYCISSIKFLALILILFYIVFSMINTEMNDYLNWIVSIIFTIPILGYSLQITHDIINYGKKLPKIQPKKLFLYGIKGWIVFNVYIFIQIYLLEFIAINLNFPQFELEDALLELTETISLFYTHNPLHTAIFIILSIIITYILVFFMEMALAQIADDGKFLNSFNLLYLKKIIDRIGWKKYTREYTVVIFSISLLSFINLLVYDVPILNLIVVTFLGLMIFVIEFGSIGLIYRECKKEELS